MEFDTALREYREQVRRYGETLLKIDPSHYESIGQFRRRTGRHMGCRTCGGAGYVRMIVPVESKLFGRAVRCPACGGER